MGGVSFISYMCPISSSDQMTSMPFEIYFPLIIYGMLAKSELGSCNKCGD